MNYSPTTPARRAALLLALAFTLAVGPASAEVVHVNATGGLTLAGVPLALHGYDAVAYFTEGHAVRGNAEFTATHDGAAYRFASAAHKASFAKSPDRYAPQYGGFCAFGVSVGAKFDGDPELFRVVDGKLYLNLNPQIQEKWNGDVDSNIEKADEAWPKIRERAASALNG